MKEYRWEKGIDFIAIESARSVDIDESVYVVDSSLPFSELPVEFREQVPHSNSAECAALVEQVKCWAEKNGYEPADIT